VSAAIGSATAGLGVGEGVVLAVFGAGEAAVDGPASLDPPGAPCPLLRTHAAFAITALPRPATPSHASTVRSLIAYAS